MATIVVLTLWATAFAQHEVRITGDRLSGFVLPIEPVTGPIELTALRASAWTVDDTKRLFMEGDVRVRVGGYDFSATEAVLWLNRIPSATGEINQLAVYFDKASDPTKQSGLGVGGEDLLITGSARGDVRLVVSNLIDKQPRSNALIERAERRLAEHLKGILATTPALTQRPQVDQPAPPEATFKPVPGGQVREKDLELPSKVEMPPRVNVEPWIARPTGIIRFSAALTEIRSGELENIITLTGPLAVEMNANTEDGDVSQLTLTAERGVIFAEATGDKGLEAGQVSVKSIVGIYLEGNVAAVVNNGQYAVRAPRMYYDLRGDRAIMLDALLRTYVRDTRVPVYARAEEMRQLAANQWDAQKVNVSTSEFFTPHLAIGAKTATITQRPATDDPKVTDTWVDSQGNALRFVGVPIIPFPGFSGRAESQPLREVEVGARDNDGIRILTTWDLFALMGQKRPDGVDAELHLDGFTERGAGGGLDFRYDVAGSYGRVDLYGLHDSGIDKTSSGLEVEPEQEFRGVGIAEHTTKFGPDWTLQAQVAFISDPTFITSWREEDFNERREYETSLYLKHQRENAAFNVLAKYELNDFLSNSYLLASKQYTVDKVPELTYRRYGDSLFDDAITYSTENRLTRMRFVFQNTTPAEIGVRGRAFGILDDDEIDVPLRDRGLHQKWVDRFDSRHELAWPLHPGIFNITPFVVGRFTGYDDGFEEFSSDADELRFFGAAGVRVNTQFQRVYNGVENSLFDLHRLRHLIEPYVTLWSAYSSVNQDDLPIYDTSVESLASGTAVEVGVRNTLQTQRGGPGRWRSVDFFTLDTAVVLTTDDDERESPTPQFFEYRPEYSQFGDHIRAQAMWLLSDSLSVVGETTYDLDNDDFARGSIGTELRHSPLFVTYIEYRFIDIDENELLAVGWTYQVTSKYQVSLSPQWDFQANDFRSVTMRLTRTFPDFNFTFQVKYDQIRDDTSVGASLALVEF